MLDGFEKMSSRLKHSCWDGVKDVVKLIAEEEPGPSQVDCVDGVREIVRLLALE